MPFSALPQIEKNDAHQALKYYNFHDYHRYQHGRKVLQYYPEMNYHILIYSQSSACATQRAKKSHCVLRRLDAFENLPSQCPASNLDDHRRDQKHEAYSIGSDDDDEDDDDDADDDMRMRMGFKLKIRLMCHDDADHDDDAMIKMMVMAKPERQPSSPCTAPL